MGGHREESVMRAVNENKSRGMILKEGISKLTLKN